MAIGAGSRLGSYEILSPLGAGGMGEVWRATHVLLGRPAAIKVIRHQSLGSGSNAHAKSLLRRFEREARATSSLRSPHTVQVYDFGITDDGGFYYVMELLEGRDLNFLIEQHGPLPAERVIYILRQICESLHEAHRSELIHRDIKPSNIILTEAGFRYDFVKVLDFGLVLRAPASDRKESRLTVEGVVAGSPAFMAPELIQGRSEVDGRADLYSLGCVAYWLLSGQLVFDEQSAMQVIAAHLSQPPEPPSARCELDIPQALEQIVMACLEKDPARRPASAAELERQLADCPVKEPWSEQRAEQWWRLHYPAGAASRAAPAEPTTAGHLPAAENSLAHSSGANPVVESPPAPLPERHASGSTAPAETPRAPGSGEIVAEPEFAVPRRTARSLFLIIQVGYLAMYFATLVQAESLQQPLYRAFLVPAGQATTLVVVFTMCSIAVRLYLLSSVGFGHPAAGVKFRRLFPVLLLLDGMWAAAPLLLAGRVGLGLPLFGVAALAYLPFSQRTLIASLYPHKKPTNSGTLPRQ